MAQVPRFNDDFTKADAAMLVQFSPLATQPQLQRTCNWVTVRGLCGRLVQTHDFAEHLRTQHGVTSPDGTQLRCCWVNCSVEMKKESLTRHVQEKHLELRYACPNCNEQFARTHTLHNHISRKHSDS